MADFHVNNLVSESSLLTNPQDALTNSDRDNTSIFGNFDTSFLGGIQVMYSTENINTPFSYDNVIKNIFEDNADLTAEDTSYDVNCYDDEEETPCSSFGFEC